MKKYPLEGYLKKRRMLKAIYNLQEGNLCDLGCGSEINGLTLWAMDRKISYTGLDINPTNKIEWSRFRLLKHDLELGALPLADNSFDNLTLLAVVEHTDNLDNLLSESRRILKPGGRMIITTPSVFAEPIIKILARVGLIDIELANQHKRNFTKKGLMNTLEKKGFRINMMGSFEFGFNILAVAEK